MTSEDIDVEKIDIIFVDNVDETDQDQYKLREPPNGGYGWIIVFGSFCGIFATQGYCYSWGVYLEHYNTHVYPGELTKLTWIGSLWYASTNSTGLFNSYLCMKFGYKWLLAVACILSGLSMMLASISTSIWQLYLFQGVLSGISSSLSWFICISGPQQWFSTRRGLAVGLAVSGSGIGGLVLNNVIRASIDTVGYRWSLRILGFMQMGSLAISFFTVKQLNPIPPGVKKPSVPIIDISIFKNKSFCVLASVYFVALFAFFIPSSFIPSYAIQLGLSPIISSNLTAIMSGLMVIGKIGNGFFSDHVGRVNMFLLCTLMCGISCLAVFYNAQTVESLWAFVALFGIFGGGYVSLSLSVITDCVGLRATDLANGWLYFVSIPGGLLGQPISALIIESNGGSYGGAIIFGGVLFLFCGLMIGVLRFMQAGCKLFIKV